MVGAVTRLNAEQQQTPTHTCGGKAVHLCSAQQCKKGQDRTSRAGATTTTGQPSSIAQAGVCRADGGERKSGEWRVGTRSLAQDWALDQGYVHLGAAGGRGTGAGVVSMFEAWTLTGPGCSLWRRVRGQDWPSDRR